MLGEGWSEPIGMSCGAQMRTAKWSYFMTGQTYTEFECRIGRGKKRMSGREKENSRNQDGGWNVVRI